MKFQHGFVGTYCACTYGTTYRLVVYMTLQVPDGALEPRHGSSISSPAFNSISFFNIIPYSYLTARSLTHDCHAPH